MTEPSRSPIKDRPLRHAGQSLEEERRKLFEDKVEPWLLLAAVFLVLAGLEWWRYLTQLPYHPLRDFAAVAAVNSSPLLLVAHPSVNVRSVRELVQLAKRHPGITCGNSGIGTVTHMTAEKFRLRAGIEVNPVSYKGGALPVIALLGGEKRQHGRDGIDGESLAIRHRQHLAAQLEMVAGLGAAIDGLALGDDGLHPEVIKLERVVGHAHLRPPLC